MTVRHRQHRIITVDMMVLILALALLNVALDLCAKPDDEFLEATNLRLEE